MPTPFLSCTGERDSQLADLRLLPTVSHDVDTSIQATVPAVFPAPGDVSRAAVDRLAQRRGREAQVLGRVVR
jgi:hypothetical protein